MVNLQQPLKEQSEPKSRQIRVFLSSTFRDFNEERYILATEVFPELNYRAKARGVELLEVDLRWGVTQEEAEDGHALEICLQEIERCRPYFIGMLGDSYGTLTPAKPDLLEASPRLLQGREWLSSVIGGSSYTEVEIEHGLHLLQTGSMDGRAFFYFRDPGYSSLKANAGHAGWRSDNKDARQRLEKLKDKIRSSHFPLVEDLKDPREVCEHIKQDLWRLIDQEFPLSEEPNAFAAEDLLHASYSNDRRKFYVDADDIFQKLDKAVLDGPGLVLVTGESGLGKSSLLANWQQVYQAKSEQNTILMHHLGCSNEASEEKNMLQRFLRCTTEITLQEDGHEESIANIHHERWALISAVNQRLAKISKALQPSGKRFIWIIDSIDRLSTNSQQSIPWLPLNIPPGICIIISALPSRVLNLLLKRKYRRIRLDALSAEQGSRFIDLHLKRYSRALDERLKGKMLKHQLAYSPLFLRIILEELRKSADYDGLENSLEDYLGAISVADLYSRVLGRLIIDYSDYEVRSILTLIWASRSGLTEAELLEITGIAPLRFFGIFIGLSDCLISSNGKHIFAHDYLRVAVELAFLGDETDKQAAHKALYMWQANRLEWDERKSEELPWQAIRLEDAALVRELFNDLTTVIKIVEYRGVGETYQLLLRAYDRRTLEIQEALGSLAERYLQDAEPRIAAKLHAANIIGNLLEEAGCHSVLFLRLRRYVLKHSKHMSLTGPHARFNAYTGLVHAYLLCGKYRQYLRSARIAYSTACNQFGQKSDRSLHQLVVLQDAKFLAGNVVQSYELTEYWYPILQKELGLEHPTFLDFTFNYGRIARSVGEYAKAIALLSFASTGYCRLYEEEHPRTIVAQAQHARALSNAHDHNHDASSAILRSCIKRISLRYPEQHPLTLDIKSELVFVYAGDQYKRVMTDLYHSSVSLLGHEHPLTIKILRRIPSTDNCDELERQLNREQVYFLSRKILGEHNIDTINAKLDLLQSNPTEALFDEICAEAINIDRPCYNFYSWITLDACIIYSCYLICEKQAQKAYHLLSRYLFEAIYILCSKHSFRASEVSSDLSPSSGFYDRDARAAFRLTNIFASLPAVQNHTEEEEVNLHSILTGLTELDWSLHHMPLMTLQYTPLITLQSGYCPLAVEKVRSYFKSFSASQTKIESSWFSIHPLCGMAAADNTNLTFESVSELLLSIRLQSTDTDNLLIAQAYELHSAVLAVQGHDKAAVILARNSLFSRSKACGDSRQRISEHAILFMARILTSLKEYHKALMLIFDLAESEEEVSDEMNLIILEASLLKSHVCFIIEVSALDPAILISLEEIMGMRSAHKLMASLSQSRNQPWHHLLFTLGIRNIGLEYTVALAAAYPSAAALAKAALHDSTSLAAIQGIGPEGAEALAEWFTHPVNLALLRVLQALGFNLAAPCDTADNSLSLLNGKTFVLTGTLPTINRGYAEKLIESVGGKVSGLLSKKTSYLVVGNDAGNIPSKAEQLGIPILDEAGLLALLGW